MLGVIMIARIYAMYQGSKNLLIFLVTALLACTIASGVMVVIGSLGVSMQEAVLSGYHICVTDMDRYMRDLNFESVISITVWEIIVLFLAVWITTKHIRELRQSPTGSTIGDCFMMLTKNHAFYFLVFAIMACFTLGSLSPNVAVRQPVTGICGCLLSQQFSAEPITHRGCCLLWHFFSCPNVADICAGTASDPQHSRILC
jgi:hypothetical protein